MLESSVDQEADARQTKLKAYYKLHAFIYDWTRWSFLFGREALLNQIPDLFPNPRILEVGCGTGKNLTNLEYLFPDGKIYGIDLSEDMIRQARKKLADDQQVKLIKGAYGSDEFNFKPFNLTLLSYSLSMLGDQVEDIIKQVHADLAPGGYIAVVDFNDTPFHWFRNWMKMNHVNLDRHLPKLLNKYFTPTMFIEQKAYLGMWSYIQFLGRRK